MLAMNFIQTVWHAEAIFLKEFLKKFILKKSADKKGIHTTPRSSHSSIFCVVCEFLDVLIRFYFGFENFIIHKISLKNMIIFFT